MKPKVYMETTVVSYLTARPSRDIVIAGHQEITRDWWQICQDKFEVVASQLVLQEVSSGDQEAAQERLNVMDTVTLLETTEDALTLAQNLVDAGVLPNMAAEDALHIEPPHVRWTVS